MRQGLAEATATPKTTAAQSAGLGAPLGAGRQPQVQQHLCRQYAYQQQPQDDTSMPLDAAGSSYQQPTNDVLLDHLVLANGQLRTVLQAAGVSSGSPLPHQHGLQEEDEHVAVLAEENYQLRQQLQQLQLQQVAQLQQQQQALADAQGDPLELDRFSDARSPAAASSVGTAGADGCSSSCSRAAGVFAGLAGGDVVGYPPTTPRSPVVMGLRGPPSLSAVQLAEAEAAAQAATQAAIQAEAAACDRMTWQYSSGNGSSCGHAQQQRELEHAAAGSVNHWSDQGFQQQQGEATHADGCAAAPLTAAAIAALAAASEVPAAAGSGLQDSIGAGLGLLQLPKLLLPQRALRRSFESTHSRGGPGSDAGSESARSNITSVTNRSAAAPWSARSTGLGAASVRSVASNGSGGLKQLANDMLLMAPAKGPSGAAAAEATFGSAAAADVIMPGSSSMLAADVGVDAAASTAAVAAAGVWFPRRNSSNTAAAESPGSSKASFAAPANQPRAVSPCSKAAALAAAAIQGLQYPNAAAQQQPQQQQQLAPGQDIPLLDAGELRLKAIRIGPSAQLPSQLPAFAAAGAAAAAQAGAAAAAFAAQVQQQQQDGLPALPRLRVLTTHGSTAASQAAATGSRRSAPAAADGNGEMDGSCNSAGSDSGFFRATDDLAHGNAAHDRAATAAAHAAAAMTAGVDLCLLESFADSEVGMLGGRMSSEYVEHLDNSRMSSDLFGARISMDGGNNAMPRASSSGAALQQQQVRLSRLNSWGAGGASDDGLAGASQRSEWLGISYQRSKLAGKGMSSLFDQAESAGTAAGSSSHVVSRRPRRSSSSSGNGVSSYARQLQQQQRLIKAGGMPPPSVPDSFFYEGLDSLLFADESLVKGVGGSFTNYNSARAAGGAAAGMSRASSDSLGGQLSGVTVSGGVDSLSRQAAGLVQTSAAAAAVVAGGASTAAEAVDSHMINLDLPDLSLLAVTADRMQQPTPVFGHTSPSAAATMQTAFNLRQHAADSAAAAAAAAGLVGLRCGLDAAAGEIDAVAAAGGGVSSEQLRQLLANLADAQQSSAAGAAAAEVARKQAAAAGAGSNSPFAVAARAPGAAAAGVRLLPLPHLTICTTAPRPNTPVSPLEQQQQQQAAAALEQQQQQQAAVAQERASQHLAAPAQLQRVNSASMLSGAQLPPKWALRSSSSSNLASLHLQQQQQRDSPSAGDAVRVQQQQQQQAHGDQSPRGVAAPAGPVDTACFAAAGAGRSSSIRSPGCGISSATATTVAGLCKPLAALQLPQLPVVSPRGIMFNTLRVVTALPHKGQPQSTGANSDVENTSGTTTPVHAPGNVLRTHSGSSLQLKAAAAAAGTVSGLASITVPPSPASSGVRYVPASPRVVGFDCPITPHSAALRSPSWRSDSGTADVYTPRSGTAAAAAGHAQGGGMYSHGYGYNQGAGGYICGLQTGVYGHAGGSGCSTPRRQPSSPGLLQQALAKQQGPAGGGSSGSSTPSGNRRAAMPPAGGFVAAAAAYAASGACNGNGSTHGGNAAGSTSPVVLGSSSSGSLHLGALAGHARTRSCSSNTLMMLLTGGQLLQQPGTMQHHYCPLYLQQPQPLPLQQQGQSMLYSPRMLRVCSDTHEVRQHLQQAAATTAAAAAAAAAAARGTGSSSSRPISPVSDTAPGSDATAAAAAGPHPASSGSTPRSQQHVILGVQQPQQQPAEEHPLHCPAAATATAAAWPEELVARSLSPVQQLQQTSSNSSSRNVVSPSKGSCDGSSHHAKGLSRFGLMAAASTTAAAEAAAAAVAAAGSDATVELGQATSAKLCSSDVVAGAAPAGAAAVVEGAAAPVLSNASSVVSPDTPLVADSAAAAAEASPTAGVTPMASTSAAAGPVKAAVHADIVAETEAAAAEDALDSKVAGARDISSAAAAAIGSKSVAVAEGSSSLQPQAVGASIDPCNEPFTPQQQQTEQQQRQQHVGAQQQQQAGCISVACSSSSSSNELRTQQLCCGADVVSPRTALGAAAAAIDGVGANASALLTKLHNEKQHQVVRASGRCAVQYVPSYMSSNPVSGLRQIATANRNSSGALGSCSSAASKRGADLPGPCQGWSPTSAVGVTSPLLRSRSSSSSSSAGVVSNPHGAEVVLGAAAAVPSGWTAAAVAAAAMQDDVHRSSGKSTPCRRTSSTDEQHRQHQQQPDTSSQDWDGESGFEAPPQQLLFAAGGCAVLDDAAAAAVQQQGSGCFEGMGCMQPGLVLQRVADLSTFDQGSRSGSGDLPPTGSGTSVRLMGKRTASSSSRANVHVAGAAAGEAPVPGPWLLKRRRAVHHSAAAAAAAAHAAVGDGTVLSRVAAFAAGAAPKAPAKSYCHVGRKLRGHVAAGPVAAPGAAGASSSSSSSSAGSRGSATRPVGADGLVSDAAVRWAGTGAVGQKLRLAPTTAISGSSSGVASSNSSSTIDSRLVWPPLPGQQKQEQLQQAIGAPTELNLVPISGRSSPSPTLSFGGMVTFSAGQPEADASKTAATADAAASGVASVPFAGSSRSRLLVPVLFAGGRHLIAGQLAEASAAEAVEGFDAAASGNVQKQHPSLLYQEFREQQHLLLEPAAADALISGGDAVPVASDAVSEAHSAVSAGPPAAAVGAAAAAEPAEAKPEARAAVPAGATDVTTASIGLRIRIPNKSSASAACSPDAATAVTKACSSHSDGCGSGSSSPAGTPHSLCSSSSSMDDDVKCDLALPAQGPAQLQVLLDLGVGIDGDALARARTRQQELLKQRHLLRQQHQRRRHEVAEQVDARQQQMLLSREGAAVAVRLTEQQQQQVDACGQKGADQLPLGKPLPLAAGASTAGASSCISNTAGAASPKTQQQQPEQWAPASPYISNGSSSTASARYVDYGSGRVAAWFSPEYAAELAVQAEEGQLPSSGLARAASCVSVDSGSNMSWAAWSTTSSVSRCPKMEWWGAEGQDFFSEKQRRRHKQQKLQGVGRSGNAAVGLGNGSSSNAGVGSNAAATLGAGSSSSGNAPGGSWWASTKRLLREASSGMAAGRRSSSGGSKRIGSSVAPVQE